MKLLKLLTISLAIFTACQPVLPQETQETEASEEIEEEPQLEKTAFSNCTDDDCLLTHAWMSTYAETPAYDGVCDAMDKNNWQYSQCQWQFATFLQEPERCDSIKSEWENGTPEYDKLEHISSKNCQLQFDHPQWKLSHGIPPYADPFTLTYVPQGETLEIEGWIVYKSPYVGPEVPHFHVKDSSMLPPLMGDNSDFLLIQPVEEDDTASAPQSLIDDLKQHDEENPGTITVKMVKYHIEGSPWMIMPNPYTI